MNIVLYDLEQGNYGQMFTDQVAGGIPLWILITIGLGIFYMLGPSPRARRRV